MALQPSHAKLTRLTKLQPRCSMSIYRAFDYDMRHIRNLTGEELHQMTRPRKRRHP